MKADRPDDGLAPPQKMGIQGIEPVIISDDEASNNTQSKASPLCCQENRTSQVGIPSQPPISPTPRYPSFPPPPMPARTLPRRQNRGVSTILRPICRHLRHIYHHHPRDLRLTCRHRWFEDSRPGGLRYRTLIDREPRKTLKTTSLKMGQNGRRSEIETTTAQVYHDVSTERLYEWHAIVD